MSARALGQNQICGPHPALQDAGGESGLGESPDLNAQARTLARMFSTGIIFAAPGQ
jgi:hypothetical protein